MSGQLLVDRLLPSNSRDHSFDVVAYRIEEEGVLHSKRSTVAVFNLITFFAAALERAFRVDAKLGTSGDTGTLIDILTEARSCQRKPLLAKTGWASRGWQADLVWSTGVN